MTDIHPPDTGEMTRQRWIRRLAAIAAVIGGLGAGLAITAANDQSAGHVSAAEVADLDQACTSWVMSTPANPSAIAWCHDMSTWMGDQIRHGRMTGPMNDDPEVLLTACHTWSATQQPASAPSTWCDAMVTSMRQHVSSDRPGRMMNGPMMGMGN